MHRVLSFQVGTGGTRGFGESSEFVTKRMCFSFIFFIGFIAFLGGFLLGRFLTERSVKLREERDRHVNLQASMLQGPESLVQPEQLLLKELDSMLVDGISFTETLSPIVRCRIISERSEKDGGDARHEHVMNSLISKCHAFDKIVDQKSSIVATIDGTREPDRWVVLSISGDGVESALELARVFAELAANRNWRPRRTMMFRFFDEPRYSCFDGLPKYLKARVVACLMVHGNAIQRNGCFVASGSDVVTSSIYETVRTVRRSIFADNRDEQRILESCKNPEDTETPLINTPTRLPLDIPHASVAFLPTVGNVTASVEAETQSRIYRRTLTRIVGLTMWRFSESQTLHWDPKYLEQDVKTTLKIITSPQFVVIKENISNAVEKLIVGARNFGQKENTMWEPNSLSSRMRNDLVVDLDRALLCPDVDLRSKTDLAPFPGLLSESPAMLMKYLENLLKCYEDALKVLMEV